MTKSKQPEREEAIADVVDKWAFDEGDTYITSFLDLAWNLNNYWNAHLFVNKKFKDSINYTNDEKYWGVPSYHIDEFRKMVNFTVSRMNGAEIIRQGENGYKVFYRFDKQVIGGIIKRSKGLLGKFF